MSLNITDAKRRLVFEITSEDVKKAKKKDKENCVIACAVRASLPGVQKIQVGVTTTRVFTVKGIERYQTPSILKSALTMYDSTGAWNLSEGLYELLPPKGWFAHSTMMKKGRRYRLDLRKRHDVSASGRKYKRHRTVNARVLEFARIKLAAA